MSGSILCYDAQHCQTSPSASTVKKLQKLLFCNIKRKKLNFSVAFSRFISCSSTLTVIKLCIITAPSISCTLNLTECSRKRCIWNIFHKFYENQTKIFFICRLLECNITSKWLKHNFFLFIYVIRAYYLSK